MQFIKIVNSEKEVWHIFISISNKAALGLFENILLQNQSNVEEEKKKKHQTWNDIIERNPADLRVFFVMVNKS